MSLVDKLYNSRRWNSRNNSTYYEGPMADLVKELEATAKKKGLTVSRWQTNRGKFDCTVTWAVHEGARPSMSQHLPESAQVVSFSGIEGQTPRSKSYKYIKSLLDAIR